MPVAVFIALLAILPLLIRAAPSCGHDFEFHMQSFLAVHEAWQAGLPVPHWVMPANWGAGEARFQFYPPLSWLLGAALGSFVPWSSVPAAFTAVCAGGAAGTMYAAVRRWRPAAQASVAAAVYGASPYLFFNAYERTAYSELLAAVWMPLFLGTLLIRPLPVGRAALLLAAFWYTNAPSGVVGCYLLLGSVLFWLWKDRRGALRHGAALLLGCLLAADYLLPAWYEQRFVEITRAVGEGMRVEDSFLFERTGQLFHDQVLRTASWIAVCTVAFGLVCAAIWRMRARPADPAWRLEEGFDRSSVLFLTLLLMVITLLQFPFTDVLWHRLPELGFLQFPWRLLLPASAASALLLGLALPPALPGKVARWAMAVGLLFAGAASAWAGLARFQPCDEEDATAVRSLFAGEVAGFAGTDEYAAAGSDNGEIQQGLPRVRLLPSPTADEGDDATDANPAWTQGRGTPGTIRIESWDVHGFAARVRPERPAYAVLRWERFPRWQVRVDGEPCGARCVLREDGLITVAVPAGRWSVLTATWQTGRDVWLGRALSASGLLLLIGLNGWRRPFMMGRK